MVSWNVNAYTFSSSPPISAVPDVLKTFFDRGSFVSCWSKNERTKKTKKTKYGDGALSVALFLVARVCVYAVRRRDQRGVPTDLREIPVDYRDIFAGPGLASLRDLRGLGGRLLRQAAVSSQMYTSK